MIIQILDHLTDEIKQIRIDVFMKEQGFEDEFDEIFCYGIAFYKKRCMVKRNRYTGREGENKMTVVIITHNSAIAPMADKVIRFKNGCCEDVIINENPTPIEKIEW